MDNFVVMDIHQTLGELVDKILCFVFSQAFSFFE